jgi:hypothetical protein
MLSEKCWQSKIRKRRPRLSGLRLTRTSKRKVKL